MPRGSPGERQVSAPLPLQTAARDWRRLSSLGEQVNRAAEVLRKKIASFQRQLPGSLNKYQTGLEPSVWERNREIVRNAKEILDGFPPWCCSPLPAQGGEG